MFQQCWQNVCCPRNGKQVFIEQTVQPRHCATAWEGGRSLQDLCPEPVARIPARQKAALRTGNLCGKDKPACLFKDGQGIPVFLGFLFPVLL